MLKNIPYWLGPILFALLFFMPLDLEPGSQNFLAIFFLTVWFWLFTEVPLFVSGLMGVSLTVLFGVVDSKTALAPFADPIIFLFLGGFLLGRALEVTKLDQVLAYRVLSSPQIADSPRKMAYGFLGLIFLFSMWISNTAAMAMFLPLGAVVIKHLRIKEGQGQSAFFIAMAYAATIGGNATPIGSPPNIIAIGFLKNIVGYDLSFIQWVAIALPVSLLILIGLFVMIKKWIPEKSSSDLEPSLVVEDYRSMTRAQKYVAAIFSGTVILWTFPSILQLIVSEHSALGQFLSKSLTASTVAVLASTLLFLVPINKKEKILETNDVRAIDWSSLLLFGSGLSLGGILFQTGLAERAAHLLSAMSGDSSYYLLIFLALGLTILFTEVASNTAASNILIPIIIALAQSMGQSTLLPVFLTALACNSAFMLPVATPPNAIVYGSGYVKKIDMIKMGMRMNLLCWLLLGGIFFVFGSLR